MKNIGVLCPRGHIPHEECQRCALTPHRPCHLTPDLLEYIRVSSDRHMPERTYTATQLLGCDRQDVLVRGAGAGYVDIESAWKMARGSMIHSHMEKAPPFPGVVAVLREIRLSVPIATRYGLFTFAGKFDMLSINRIEEHTAYCTLYDYKTTGEITHAKLAADDGHVMQLSMYAALVESDLLRCTQDVTELNGVHTVIVERVELFYGDMKKTRIFSSATPRTAKGKQISRSEKTNETIQLEQMPLLPAEVSLAWVRERIEDKEKAKSEMPDMIDEDRRWLCLSCPVKSTCDAIERSKNDE